MNRFPLTLEEWTLKKQLITKAFQKGWTIRDPEGGSFDHFDDISQTPEGDIEVIFRGQPGTRHIVTKEEWNQIENLLP